MRKSIPFLLGIVLLTASCRQENLSDGFTIRGELSEADGKTLYLDWMGINAIETVDSTVLKSDGAFEFRRPRPDGYDFYRLRADGQIVYLSVDSNETLTVRASLPAMSVGYQVEGSENCARLKELVMKQMGLQREVDRIVGSGSPETGTMALRVQELVDVFKSEVAQEYIFRNPDSPCAYYALFMRINGVPLFRPQESRQDAKYFASVATVMDVKNPDALRSRNLHNIALKGMRVTARSVQTTVSEEEAARMRGLVTESGLIEIELPDVTGTVRRLTDLKGKVVLLDFTAFKSDYSPTYNLQLRDLYNKYAEKGFEIFQVSVDPDRHYWAVGSENLPWICVHDEDGLDSEYLRIYRVESLPTSFLLNRDNDIVERLQSSRDIGEHVAALLGAE